MPASETKDVDGAQVGLGDGIKEQSTGRQEVHSE